MDGGVNQRILPSENMVCDLITHVQGVRAKSTHLYYIALGCLKNAKSLKSQAPQGFSGCLDIDNDQMNKKNFLSASPRVN